MKNFLLIFYCFPVALLSLAGCDDEPVKEDVPEMITTVTLTFTASGKEPVIVTATDPDGEGVQDLVVDGPAILDQNTDYLLRLSFMNELISSGHDVTAEIADEGTEHLIFFGWTNDLFANPTGNGNIDNRADAVNYQDADEGGLPLGLETLWTTSGTGTGHMRILLKHQPGVKSATSSSEDGESDVDLEIPVNVE